MRPSASDMGGLLIWRRGGGSSGGGGRRSRGRGGWRHGHGRAVCRFGRGYRFGMRCGGFELDILIQRGGKAIEESNSARDIVGDGAAKPRHAAAVEAGFALEARNPLADRFDFAF